MQVDKRRLQFFRLSINTAVVLILFKVLQLQQALKEKLKGKDLDARYVAYNDLGKRMLI